MNALTPAEQELVALGAALGSNCVPCIEYHVPEARKAGLSERQIEEAIRLADRIRKVPARKVLAAAFALLPEAEPLADTEPQGCGSAKPAVESPVEPACCG
jgi:AhpD family alkylhydroperoxidase